MFIILLANSKKLHVYKTQFNSACVCVCVCVCVCIYIYIYWSYNWIKAFSAVAQLFFFFYLFTTACVTYIYWT